MERFNALYGQPTNVKKRRMGRVFTRVLLLWFGTIKVLGAGLLATDTGLGVGDFPGDQTIRTLIAVLSRGSNTVQGTQVLDTSQGNGLGDTFTILLPEGLVLVSNTLTITNASLDVAGGTLASAEVFQPATPGYKTVLSQQLFSGDGTYDLTPSVSFANTGPQELWYSLQFRNLAQGDLSPSYDWTWELQTAQASPEPAPLAGAALGLMLILSRRLRRASRSS